MGKFFKLAEQKYVIRQKPRSRKRRAKNAAKSAISSGIGSGLLTTLFNAGSPKAWKHGLTTGAIVGPVLGTFSYVTQPKNVTYLQKTAAVNFRIASKLFSHLKGGKFLLRETGKVIDDATRISQVPKNYATGRLKNKVSSRSTYIHDTADFGVFRDKSKGLISIFHKEPPGSMNTHVLRTILTPGMKLKPAAGKKYWDIGKGTWFY